MRPRRVGICGTDYHIFEGKHPFLQYPRVMGHELAVEVVEAPPGSAFRRRRDLCRQPLSFLRPLHRLPRREAELLRPHLGARRAPDGGMAEFLCAAGRESVRADGLTRRRMRDRRIPCDRRPCRAARRRSQSGDNVLVVGAGPIGLGAALSPASRAASVAIFDRDAERAEAAQSIAGVDGLPARADAREAVADCDERGRLRCRLRRDRQPGAPWRQASTSSPMAGATSSSSVVKETITFRDPDFHRKEMTLFGSRNATVGDFERVIAAIRAGDVPVDRLITHRTSLAGAVEDIPRWATQKSRAHQGADRDRRLKPAPGVRRLPPGLLSVRPETPLPTLQHSGRTSSSADQRAFIRIVFHEAGSSP